MNELREVEISRNDEIVYLVKFVVSNTYLGIGKDCPKLYASKFKDKNEAIRGYNAWCRENYTDPKYVIEEYHYTKTETFELMNTI